MRERSSLYRLATPLNLHLAAVVIFLLVDAVVGVRLLLAWHRSGSDRTAEYTQQLATYAQLKASTAKLQDLPEALQSSNSGAQQFFTNRIAPSDSALLTEFGRLATKDNVHWSRANYAPHAAIPGLLEYRVDASVGGQYTDVMHFINDLERDKDHVFFIIRSVVLSGAQAGAVDLRLRVDTYVRADERNAPVIPISAAGESQ